MKLPKIKPEDLFLIIVALVLIAVGLGCVTLAGVYFGVW